MPRQVIVKSVVEGLNTDGGFQQLLNEIEGWGSPGSGSMPLDQTTDQSNFEVSGFAAGWQSHMVQTAGVTSDLCIGEDRPAADDRIGDQTLLDVDGGSLAYGTEGLARI
jgi:hypothetical protein